MSQDHSEHRTPPRNPGASDAEAYCAAADHDPNHASPEERPRNHCLRWILLIGGAVIILVLGLTIGRRWLIDYLTTVSTDDAYVNGHASTISARVAGNVVRLYVDDNDTVTAVRASE
jgi:membrane fusion protein (multidrug efflux system)